MKTISYYGYSIDNCRSETGALLGKELEKIYDFLRQHGLLVAECFNGVIVIPHPDLFDCAEISMVKSGFQPLLIATNLHALREIIELSIVETRIIETLTPSSLVVSSSPDSNRKHMPVAIPDSFDLRDLCSLYNGCLKVFLKIDGESVNSVLNILESMNLNNHGFSYFGVLKSPDYDGDYPPSKATIVQITSPDDIECILEGDINIEKVRKASKAISICEIGEWT